MNLLNARCNDKKRWIISIKNITENKFPTASDKRTVVFSSSDDYSNEKYDHDVDDVDNYRSNTDIRAVE